MKNKIIFGKRGSETTITIYWFAILMIVAVAIVYMVTSAYGKPYDVRGIEADILANNIADCISQGGYVNANTLADSSFKAKFLEQCKLNFKTEEGFADASGEYYAEVISYDFDTNKRTNSDISYGNLVLKQYCELKGTTLPVCTRKNIYLIDEQQNKYGVTILTVVNKAEKNA
jgi:hypothetical protein